MKTATSMNTVDFFTFCELHQLWQAVILKPLKLEECILHFWKSPIFINLVPTSQGHCCVLNTKKSILKINCFITVSLLGVFTFLLIGVANLDLKGIIFAVVALGGFEGFGRNPQFLEKGSRNPQFLEKD